MCSGYYKSECDSPEECGGLIQRLTTAVYNTKEEFIEYEQEKISFLKRYVEVGEEYDDSSDDEVFINLNPVPGNVITLQGKYTRLLTSLSR